MGVTRFPNGLSFVKPNVYALNTGNFYFAPGDTTPDVSQGSFFVCAASALTITNFDSGQQGQLLFVYAPSGGAITIQDSQGGIQLTDLVYSVSAGFVKVSANTGNVLLNQGEIIQFVHNGTDWSQVGTRVTDTAQV